MSAGQIDLLPCPFCGGRAAIQQGGHTKYVMCLGCEVMGPNLESNEELIAAWNARPSKPMREALNAVAQHNPLSADLGAMMFDLANKMTKAFEESRNFNARMMPSKPCITDPIKRITGKEKP